jgi:hypothetical protein
MDVKTVNLSSTSLEQDFLRPPARPEPRRRRARSLPPLRRRGSAGPGASDGVTDTEARGASDGAMAGDGVGAIMGDGVGAGDMGAMVGVATGAATGASRSGEGANAGGRADGGNDAGAMAMGGSDTGDGVAVTAREGFSATPLLRNGPCESFSVVALYI